MSALLVLLAFCCSHCKSIRLFFCPPVASLKWAGAKRPCQARRHGLPHEGSSLANLFLRSASTASPAAALSSSSTTTTHQPSLLHFTHWPPATYSLHYLYLP